MIQGPECLLAFRDRATRPGPAYRQPFHESALIHGPAIDVVRHLAEALQAATMYIPSGMDTACNALDRQYLGDSVAASPDEMRLWAVFQVLMVPSYAPSRIHPNGKTPLRLSLMTALAD